MPSATLLHTRKSRLTGGGAVSLSSFGGEGQGEEAVFLNQRARYITAAPRWKAVMNRSIENCHEPPLPHPLLQREERENQSHPNTIRQKTTEAMTPTVSATSPAGSA
jgi:hypothetical protein